MRRLRATLVALSLAAAPAAAQETVVFRVDPGSDVLPATLQAIGSDLESFSVGGTIEAEIVQSGPGGPVESFDPVGGQLQLTQNAPLAVTFGSGFGDGGGPHVSLALTSTPIGVVLVGGERATVVVDAVSSELPLLGLKLDLVSGGYEATGEIFEQPVAVDVDLLATPTQLELTSGDALFVIDPDATPPELSLRLPVQLGVLVVSSPLYVPLRFGGELVLRAPLCGRAGCTAACSDRADNDGDGAADYPADPGCTSAADVSERDASRPCDDGFDNDGDGWYDAGDPVCLTSSFPREQSRCQNGVNDDGQLGTDFDAGVSILGAGNGDPSGPDPHCVGHPERDTENAPLCGLGGELALALAALRRRATSRP
jgi:hypothetical protein